LSLKRTVFEIFDLYVYSDLETRVIGSLEVIENDTIRSGTKFLLTFHTNHRMIGLSHTVSEKNGDFSRKSPIFRTQCI